MIETVSVTSHTSDVPIVVNQWFPRVGDLVKRRDDDRIAGTIKGFKTDGQGHLRAELEPVNEGYKTFGGLAPVGLLEPVSIEHILLHHSPSIVHKVFDRMREKS